PISAGIGADRAFTDMQTFRLRDEKRQAYALGFLTGLSGDGGFFIDLRSNPLRDGAKFWNTPARQGPLVTGDLHQPRVGCVLIPGAADVHRAQVALDFVHRHWLAKD